jgi:type I restriction enzyme S subunit
MSSVVPDGWNEPRVRDLFTLNTKSVVPNDSPQEKFTYFSLPAYDEFGTSIEVYGSEIESNKFEINDTSVLVSKLNPRKPRVMYAKPEKLRACASTEFMSFVPIESNGVSLNYFTHYFFSELFQKRLELVATGSTNSHVRVSPKETTNWRIAVPPLPEQKKIASILTSVDEVIENTQKQIDKLQDLKKATMNELLTKGIGHTEFKDSELGRIPKSWEVQSLLEVATNGISNGVFNDPKKQGGDYRLINVYDMYQGFGVDIQKLSRLELSEKEFLNNRVEYGDIFLTRSSLKLEGIAHCNICLNDSENLTYDGHLMKITPNKSLVAPIYLALQCLSDAGRLFLMRMAKQSTMTTIGQQDIAPLPIPLPSLEEQRQIIGIHESFEVRLKRLKTKVSQTQSLKKSLMQDLLTGKVRVTVN